MASDKPRRPVGVLENPHDVDLKPSKIPLVAQYSMLGLFLLAVVVSGGFAIMEHWRRATFTLGAALVWLAVVRFTCDSKVLSVLAVRSRRFDVAFTTTVGALILFLSGTVDSLGS
ncbi:MAG: DUF3017 domain-containing protein [Corynebacterium sp.]|nr:DUF3017 domain-containing protein [Corynebacterium sp.]